MKTAVLASGVIALGLIGAAGGYLVGDLTQPTSASANNEYPTGGDSPPDVPLPKKTAEPYPKTPLSAAKLRYHTENFTIRDKSGAQVPLSIRAPRGWQLTRDPKAPQEVKFLDPLKERGIRVESALPESLTTSDSMQRLIAGLESSQPYENDLKILSQDEQIEIEGTSRTAATLIYTYIPKKTLRYVIVAWVSTRGDDLATVEMSITGLPQDATALKALLAEATKSVTVRDY
ncbi:hypothetical protein [Kribbella italica]|uniref:Lipoprotein LpqN n=1 Tax=Kribbella italica TaxID=1540520 RepID=A0A7W9JBJ0_9ACTN|nr:hypothetical protein [Kribbella italica]MBB5838752.1 hypothetical protein [Kribbella italica]